METELALIRVLESRTAPLRERVDAATRLRAVGADAAREALLRVASDLTAPDALASASGGSLAFVNVRLGRREPPLADLTGPAYLAYDQQMAELEGAGS